MKKILLFLILLISILSIANFAYAGSIDTNSYKDIYLTTGVSDLRNKAGMAIQIVQIIGTSVALVALIALGIKYMISSPDEKATIKQAAVPYVIGVIIFFAAANLVAIVISFAMDM